MFPVKHAQGVVKEPQYQSTEHCGAQQYSISLERCSFSHSNAVSKIHAILLLMYIESQGCFRGAPMLVRFVQDYFMK